MRCEFSEQGGTISKESPERALGLVAIMNAVQRVIVPVHWAYSDRTLCETTVHSTAKQLPGYMVGYGYSYRASGTVKLSSLPNTRAYNPSNSILYYFPF